MFETRKQIKDLCFIKSKANSFCYLYMNTKWIPYAIYCQCTPAFVLWSSLTSCCAMHQLKLYDYLLIIYIIFPNNVLYLVSEPWILGAESTTEAEVIVTLHICSDYNYRASKNKQFSQSFVTIPLATISKHWGCFAEMWSVCVWSGRGCLWILVPIFPPPIQILLGICHEE